jgi:hypothetical protein
MAHEILMTVYKRLGTDEPHRSLDEIVKKKNLEEATDPRTPNGATEKKTKSTVNIRDRTIEDNIYTENAVCNTSRGKETLRARTTTSRSIASPLLERSGKRDRKKIADPKPYL